MYDLAIAIPARDEEWIGFTVADLLKNIRGNTEIRVVLDGYTTKVPYIPSDPRVTVMVNETPVGQRAATNQALKGSTAPYVAKCDAHTAYSHGFDLELLEAFKVHGDNVCLVPVMRNLHLYDLVCPKNHVQYQGTQTKCKECGEELMRRVIWDSKTNPQSIGYAFSPEPKFQYMNEIKKRDSYKRQLSETGCTETFSLQGSFFACSRECYWKYKCCDESLYSWGSHGLSLALRFWLGHKDGKCLVVHGKDESCWYGHLFRTSGFGGFPYPQEESKIQENKRKLRKFFWENQWNLQVRPSSWLVDRFLPIAGWTDEAIEEIRKEGEKFYLRRLESEKLPLEKKENPKVGALFYTDNEMIEPLGTKVKEQILKVIGDKPLVSMSLKPISFGVKNGCLPLKRGKETMHRQILEGLLELDRMGIDVVYFMEQDILYAEGYTDFIPSDPNVYYYNSNLFRVRTSDGLAVSYDHKSLSQLCAYVKKLIPEYRERVRRIEAEGFDKNGYECGTRSIKRGGFSNDRSETWHAEKPNIDLRWGGNLSASKWTPEEFKSQRSCRNWKTTSIDEIEEWPNLREIIGIPEKPCLDA
jgi:hypothetical protein